VKATLRSSNKKCDRNTKYENNKRTKGWGGGVENILAPEEKRGSETKGKNKRRKKMYMLIRVDSTGCGQKGTAKRIEIICKRRGEWL
jgi:hypothetical protein